MVFVPGIYLGSKLPYDACLLGVVGSLFGAVLFTFYHFNQKLNRRFRWRWLGGVSAAIFFFFIGLFTVQVSLPVKLLHSGKYHFSGIVDEISAPSGGRVRLTVSVDSLIRKDSLLAGQLKGLLYVNAAEGDLQETSIGKRIAGSGWMHPTGNQSMTEGFSYSEYLYRSGYSFTMSISAYHLSKNREVNGANVFIAGIRQRLKDVYRSSGVSEATDGVIEALVLGDRSGLSSETRQDYVKAGAVHLLAVSGLHLGIFYLFIMVMLGWMQKGRFKWILFCTVLLFLWGYAWVTMFSPSVTRAAIMFSVLLITRYTRRKGQLFNTLAASAFVILLIQPLAFFHAGFWLSHLAVAGIGMFYNGFNNLFQFSFIGWRWIWSIISVSLAAQLATLPIGLYLFHGFPVYFLIANILILPVMSVVLISSLVLLVLPVGSFLALMMSGMVTDLISYMNGVVAWISSMPMSYLTNFGLGFFEMILLFAGIICLYIYVRNYQSRYLSASILTVAIFLLVLNGRLWMAENSNEMIIRNQSGNLIINVMNGRSGIIIAPEGYDEKQASYLFASSWADRMIFSPRLCSYKDLEVISFIELGNQRYVYVTAHRLPADWQNNERVKGIILNGNSKIDPHDLINYFQPSEIIIAPTKVIANMKELKRVAELNNIRLVDFNDTDYYCVKN
jgi:competence protein ComEC